MGGEQPAAVKAGGGPEKKKKRGMSLTVLIEAGVIQEGAVLRYMKARRFTVTGCQAATLMLQCQVIPAKALAPSSPVAQITCNDVKVCMPE